MYASFPSPLPDLSRETELPLSSPPLLNAFHHVAHGCSKYVASYSTAAVAPADPTAHLQKLAYARHASRPRLRSTADPLLSLQVGLTSFGTFFMLLGVIMLFDGALLALGNVSDGFEAGACLACRAGGREGEERPVAGRLDQEEGKGRPATPPASAPRAARGQCPDTRC